MIGVFAAKNNCLCRLAFYRPIGADQPHVGVICLGTGTGEKDVVQPIWRKFRHFLRQGDGRDMAGLEKRIVIGQLGHLPGGDVSKFCAAIPDIHAPKTGHAV